MFQVGLKLLVVWYLGQTAQWWRGRLHQLSRDVVGWNFKKISMLIYLCITLFLIKENMFTQKKILIFVNHFYLVGILGETSKFQRCSHQLAAEVGDNQLKSQ